MLPDYNPVGSYVPKRFRHMHTVVVRATIGASGAATLVTADSSPRVGISRVSAGIYRVTMDKGQRLYYLGGGVEQAAESVAASDGTVISPALLLPNAGTASLLIQRPDSGAVADPPSGSTLTVEFQLGKA